jgi:hypothetical protein
MSGHNNTRHCRATHCASFLDVTTILHKTNHPNPRCPVQPSSSHSTALLDVTARRSTTSHASTPSHLTTKHHKPTHCSMSPHDTTIQCEPSHISMPFQSKARQPSMPRQLNSVHPIPHLDDSSKQTTPKHHTARCQNNSVQPHTTSVLDVTAQYFGFFGFFFLSI